MKSIVPFALLSFSLGCVTLYELGSAQGFRENWLPHASFDFSCPAAQLTVQSMGDNVVAVRGCGKKASYIFQMDNDSQSWLMNGAVSTDDAAPKPQTATPTAR